MGDIRLRKIGRVVYNHTVPFLTLRNRLCLYGFSMAFSRDELRYILPFPSSVPGHDTYIQYSAKWRGKLHFIDEPCAIHRYSGLHNVSSFGKNNIMAPPIIRLWYRIVTYTSVIWRSFIR